MSSDVDVLKSFFAAINRNDMQAVARYFDPQIVRVEFEGLPTAGTYHGIAAVHENVRAGRGTWAEGRCEPEQFLVAGERVVVYLHAWVRLHGATDWTGAVLPMASCSGTVRSPSTAPSVNARTHCSGQASRTRSRGEAHPRSVRALPERPDEAPKLTKRPGLPHSAWLRVGRSAAELVR